MDDILCTFILFSLIFLSLYLLPLFSRSRSFFLTNSWYFILSLFQTGEPYCSQAEDNCGNVVAAIIWFYTYYFFVTFILLNVLIGEWQTKGQTDLIDRQEDRQEDRWTDRRINRLTERWMEKQNKQAERTDGQTAGQTERLTDVLTSN